MTQVLTIHPEDPQLRLIRLAVDCIQAGGVIAYPTDSAYALGCQLGNKSAADRIRQIRNITDDHNFSLICRDLSDISTYARVDNSSYRLLKSHTPGPYTFILQASKEVPRRLQHPKRKTIGIRVPDNRITQMLVDELGEPLMSVTCQLPNDELPLSNPDTVKERMSKRVDLIIDGGACSLDPTSILDLTDGTPVVIREGRGDVEAFV